MWKPLALSQAQQDTVLINALISHRKEFPLLPDDSSLPPSMGKLADLANGTGRTDRTDRSAVATGASVRNTSRSESPEPSTDSGDGGPGDRSNSPIPIPPGFTTPTPQSPSGMPEASAMISVQLWETPPKSEGEKSRPPRRSLSDGRNSERWSSACTPSAAEPAPMAPAIPAGYTMRSTAPATRRWLLLRHQRDHARQMWRDRATGFIVPTAGHDYNIRSLSPARAPSPTSPVLSSSSEDATIDVSDISLDLGMSQPLPPPLTLNLGVAQPLPPPQSAAAPSQPLLLLGLPQALPKPVVAQSRPSLELGPPQPLPHAPPSTLPETMEDRLSCTTARSAPPVSQRFRGGQASDRASTSFRSRRGDSWRLKYARRIALSQNTPYAIDYGPKAVQSQTLQSYEA
jgi:hypothetical protein